MQFAYEFLTPDRFQQLVQALITRTYPDAQCYPIGQKDGGRDALDSSSTDEIVVFQVKFRRERLSNDDAFQILKPVIDAEVPKAVYLKARGVRKYILITNLGGTGALDTGSMDRTQSYVNEVLPIPALIWWRADIDARLNDAYDVMWRFSEVLNGHDVLRRLVDDSLGEQARRRRLAVENYLVHQYEEDQYVKFKQADLQSSALLSLFVDVPMGLGPMQGGELLRETRRSHALEVIKSVARDCDYPPRGVIEVGGATLLAHAYGQRYFTRAVIEGAPGQGKSTLAQYLCQVQRMRFLNSPELEQIPKNHQIVPARIPFKVDLRDFALWLKGMNPISGVTLPSNTITSLESFLAAQVQHFSGGFSFSVDDVQLFLSKVPALIFLDGLDEVSPMSDRRAVVEQVSAASSRIQHSSSLTQIIVTSRPAAVANAPQFNSDAWTHLRLHSINEDLIYEYVERWGTARKLTKGDIMELASVLRRKLSSTHIKDLARNTMQLTILLNLVHVRGHALPDHRTALYDAYIDIFFNREAANNQIVRENRQLLIDIHGYLAWRMHSASETRRTGGRVREEALRDMISEFLQSRESPVDTLDELLDGVVQRIVALVSRVEGTFEFEVQPLREYFAARHLYNTAAYSPVGDPKSGTKTEIFEAIAPNPFWLNVTRFYSGCYSVGEIAGLGNQIKDLLEIGDRALTSLPRTIASALLSDRVFHQAPRVRKAVVESALGNLMIRYAFLYAYSDGRSINLSLPEDEGRTEVIRFLISSALSAPSEASRIEIATLVKRIYSTAVRQVWQEFVPELSDKKAYLTWLRFGANIGTLHSIDRAAASALAQESEGLRLLLVAAGHRAVLQTASDQRAAILETVSNTSEIDRIEGAIWQVSSAINSVRFGSAFRHRLFYSDPVSNLGDILDPKLRNLVLEIRSILEKCAPADCHSPGLFDALIAAYEEALGETWLSWCVASAFVSQVKFSELKDSTSTSLAMHFAREGSIKRSSKSWWRTSLSSLDDVEHSLPGRVLIFCQVATPSNIRANYLSLDEHLKSLDSTVFQSILKSLRQVTSAPLPSELVREMLSGRTSARLKVILGFRAPDNMRLELVASIPSEALENSGVMADTCMEWLLQQKISTFEDAEWYSYAKEAARIYPWVRVAFTGIHLRTQKTRMPPELARKILSNSAAYPAPLIGIADQVLSDSQYKSSRSVGATARRRRWTANG